VWLGSHWGSSDYRDAIQIRHWVAIVYIISLTSLGGRPSKSHLADPRLLAMPVNKMASAISARISTTTTLMAGRGIGWWSRLVEGILLLARSKNHGDGGYILHAAQDISAYSHQDYRFSWSAEQPQKW